MTMVTGSRVVIVSASIVITSGMGVSVVFTCSSTTGGSETAMANFVTC